MRELSAVAVGLAALLWCGGAAAEEGFPANTKVAVVDVSMVFKSYKRVQDVQRQVDAQFDERRKALNKEAKALNDEKQKVNEMRQQGIESDAYFDRFQHFEKRLFQWQKQQEKLELDMVLRLREEMRNVLNEIRAAIRKEAEKGSYQLVLRAADRDDPTENPLAKPVEDMSPEEVEKLDPKKRQEVEIKQILTPKSTVDLLIRTKRNPVLYGNWQIDITEGVLKRLNDDYEKMQKQP